jgi:hypothetical protein
VLSIGGDVDGDADVAGEGEKCEEHLGLKDSDAGKRLEQCPDPSSKNELEEWPPCVMLDWRSMALGRGYSLL